MGSVDMRSCILFPNAWRSSAAIAFIVTIAMGRAGSKIPPPNLATVRPTRRLFRVARWGGGR